MEEIIIDSKHRRKLSMDWNDNGSIQLCEQIGTAGDRSSIDIVSLSKDEAIKLRNILNGLLGGAAEC